MKQIDGFWIDENNNKWDTKIYTEEEAEKRSKSLVNCYNCKNCRNCIGCCYCHDCHDCCYCHDCRYCRYCRYCCNCDYCNYCRNYKSDPQRYTTKKIGSRLDTTTFYYGETENGMEVQIICGCFRGNLEKFEKAVLETHKDNFFYRKQYLKEIEKVKVLFDLEVE